MPVLIFSFSEFPLVEAQWPLILALQKDPLTKGGKLWLSFLSPFPFPRLQHTSHKDRSSNRRQP